MQDTVNRTPTEAQAARGCRCALCEKPPGTPCQAKPEADHLARPSPLPSEPRPAIEAPPTLSQRVEVHHHWHGVSPEDVAAIIARQQEDQP